MRYMEVGNCKTYGKQKFQIEETEAGDESLQVGDDTVDLAV